MLSKHMTLSCVLFILFFSARSQNNISERLCHAAVELTKQPVTYDPSYFRMPYPSGDVPSGRGVCTDVIIRAYRKIGYDLQQLVHEDMKNNFRSYPQIWGLKTTDRNIDHRRVPNLITFFTRHGEKLRVSSDPSAYKPGDIVTWNLGGGITHIGIVINERSNDKQRNLVVHNIGQGQVIADFLFDFPVTAHFRYPVIN